MVVGELADAADLLVIGGGPGGYAAAIRGAQLGREVTLVERSGPAGLGGVCLHVGCIPSKALIELASAPLARASCEGAVCTPTASGCRSSASRPGGRAVRGSRPRGLRATRPRAACDRRRRGTLQPPRPRRGPHAAGRVVFLEFEHAIVATGSRPEPLPSLPCDGERVLDSTGALALTAVPASVAVVGAGYIGLELGTALAKLGARVTVVEALDRVLRSVDAVARRARPARAWARWASTSA